MGPEAGNVSNGCWAEPLGNCGGGISREHYVSKCLFPDQSIFVQGLDWCLDKPKMVRIESLTAKILCKQHNSALSELDTTAASTFDTMRGFGETNQKRDKFPRLNWAPIQFAIDGPKLERWCLKTLLGFSFGRQLIIGPGPHGPGSVPSSLVRVAFGLEEFANGCGLYVAFRPNETFDLRHHFGYIAKARGPHLVMGCFRLHGFRFYLNLFPTVNSHTGIEDSQVFYRRAHFAKKFGERFSHQLSISWPNR
jgi:hypothetical protein